MQSFLVDDVTVNEVGIYCCSRVTRWNSDEAISSLICIQMNEFGIERYLPSSTLLFEVINNDAVSIVIE